MLIILEVMVNFLVIIGRDGSCYFGGNNLGIFFCYIIYVFYGYFCLNNISGLFN